MKNEQSDPILISDREFFSKAFLMANSLRKTLVKLGLSFTAVAFLVEDLISKYLDGESFEAVEQGESIALVITLLIWAWLLYKSNLNDKSFEKYLKGGIR